MQSWNSRGTGHITIDLLVTDFGMWTEDFKRRNRKLGEREASLNGKKWAKSSATGCQWSLGLECKDQDSAEEQLHTMAFVSIGENVTEKMITINFLPPGQWQQRKAV